MKKVDVQGATFLDENEIETKVEEDVEDDTALKESLLQAKKDIEENYFTSDEMREMI
ncbi:hypothetical protein KFZ58_03065 [Virgibacillus sp. NKC19-16]|uniref:hypothetical protein n=1 Tax=Virgibacillus salidurans TaxID=2831673 RepID=UPI001F44FFC6|nr:hypothetical protein [Virgibacillus sp. NKC19-16]UJL46944.1 hypothetical protein KFZ58_03065 [Virgibacillus sp. NKC19-16]